MDAEGTASSSQPGTSDPHRLAIADQVERLLASPQFKGSHRASSFLKHVTTCALDGKTDDLRERVLGMDLFGRAESFDPSADSVVRVSASDVRKRLLQYYSAPGHEAELRIDLPLGTYVPEFRANGAQQAQTPEPQVVEAKAPAPAWRRWGKAAALLTMVAAAAFAWVRFAGGPDPVLNVFWRPLATSPNAVLITLGNADVYLLSDRVYRDFERRHPGMPADGVVLDPAIALTTQDLVSQRGQYVGVGGAQAVLKFGTQLTAMGKSCFLRTGRGFNFNDLRDHPAILIGAYSNEWTIRAVRDLRFYLATDTEVIRDRQDAARSWLYSPEINGKPAVDYAIAARIVHSDTGNPLLIAAGIKQFACASAAEFMTQPKLLSAGLSGAPRDWSERNAVWVIRTTVQAGVPGPPEVVASHFGR